MKNLFQAFAIVVLISFKADATFAQVTCSGIHLVTGALQAMVYDYPLSPYLLKGTAPVIKVGGTWGENRLQDVTAVISRPKLRPREVEQNYTSTIFATLHYSFLPKVISKPAWRAWAGPSVTARGSYRELEDVSGELIVSLDAKMKFRIPIKTKGHLSGGVYFPLINFVDCPSYGLGSEEMGWVSLSKLQSVTSELLYSRLIAPRLSVLCGYEFMYYQYTLAEKKKILTQQFQLGLTFHFKSNEI